MLKGPCFHEVLAGPAGEPDVLGKAPIRDNAPCRVHTQPHARVFACFWYAHMAVLFSKCLHARTLECTHTPRHARTHASKHTNTLGGVWQACQEPGGRGSVLWGFSAQTAVCAVLFDKQCFAGKAGTFLGGDGPIAVRRPWSKFPGLWQWSRVNFFALALRSRSSHGSHRPVRPTVHNAHRMFHRMFHRMPSGMFHCR